MNIGQEIGERQHLMPKRRIIHDHYIEQHKNYPALIQLFTILMEQNNRNGFGYASSVIQELNTTLMEIHNNGIKDYFVKLVREDFIKKVNKSKCLGVDKSYLINYIKGRTKNFLQKRSYG